MSWNQDIAIPAMPGGPTEADGKEHHEAWEWLAYACRDASLAQKAAESAVAKVDALAAKVATPAPVTMTAADRQAIVAALAPAVADELAKRLGNG